MEGFSPEMFVTPTRAHPAHPQQYADPSPPFIDDHRYYNVEGKVKLFRRSGARKNLLNMYYQTPVFGQQPPGHGQASSSSFREPKVNFRRSGARKNLLNMYYQAPVFGQQPPGYGQASSSSFRVWKDAEKSKISPYLKNKMNGKYHSMSKQSPKVKANSFFFHKILIIYF